MIAQITRVTLFFYLQANQSPLNSIEIFKLSNISGKRRDLVPSKRNEDGSDMDDENEDSDSDDEDEPESTTPILQARLL